jgi:hypothetical protein
MPLPVLSVPVCHQNSDIVAVTSSSSFKDDVSKTDFVANWIGPEVEGKHLRLIRYVI